MKVRDIMSEPVISHGPKATVHEVLKMMLRYNVNDVAIVDDDRKVLGVVTHADIFRALLPSQQEFTEDDAYLLDPESIEQRASSVIVKPIEAIMSKDVITVTPDSAAVKAGGRMLTERIKQLPVVEGGKLVGIISITDLTRWLCHHH